MDIAEFLLARIAEDEAGIENLAQDWDVRLPPYWFDKLDAECEAKRRVVEEWRRSTAPGAYPLAGPTSGGAAHGLRWAIRILAQPYSDHPDFNPSWAFTAATA